MALALRFGDGVETPVWVCSDPRELAQPPICSIAIGLEGARSAAII